MPSELLAELLPVLGEINAVLDPDELLPTIARQLRRIIDYRILDIFLPAADGRLVPAYVEGHDPAPAATLRIPPGQGIVGTAAETREPVFVPDVARDPRYIPLAPGVVAELAIPLVNKDRLVGVLNVEGPDAEAFSTHARTALQVLASHLAVAIENATLYRETRWYAGLLATLYEIGKETASILDLDALLHRVAEIVKRVIDYEMFAILLVDEERDELVLRKWVNFGPAMERRRLPISEGLCGAAVRSKEPILVGDVRKDPRYVSLIPEARSELVVPLVNKDRVVGVFDLESPALDRFTEEHVKVLTPLASQVAVAIENAALYAALKKNERRLQRELRIARDIQRALFPEESPAGPGWAASAHFRPARELGGDLYDFYDMGSGLLGVATGDVAGKGVPAALYAAFASGTVRSRAFERRGPADLMRLVNRTLRHRGIEGLFCTLGYALFDFKDETVRVASSGLPYPLHFRAASGRCAPIEVGGLPLGAFDGATYEEASIALATGDVFVFHTDGLTDARGERGEEYGAARLVGQVEAHSRLPAPELGEKILED
ncbi:MAG TPA: GAF domain-containing protein, partial [Vicinamibacteria bacterium]|nr:GAF domain-containing protein [Vicinamibacteria bacterium]